MKKHCGNPRCDKFVKHGVYCKECRAARKQKLKKAYTLIELLTVISIITVLSSLLLPALTKAKAKAKMAQCKNNLRQMGIALVSYSSEFDWFPPYEVDPESIHSDGMKWYDVLRPYLPNGWSNGVYQCPSYRSLVYDGRFGGGGFYASFGSYAYNFGSSDANDKYWYGLAGFYWAGPTFIRARKENEVVSPSDCIALGDSFSRSYYTPSSNILEGVDWMTRKLHDFRERPMALRLKAASDRHGNRSQITFCDGHVEAIRLQELLLDDNPVYLRRWHIDNLPHKELFTP